MLNAKFPRVPKYGFHLFGSPSALTRAVCNAEFELTAYRAAVYWQMGRREPVEEIGPTWDDKHIKTKWLQA